MFLILSFYLFFNTLLGTGTGLEGELLGDENGLQLDQGTGCTSYAFLKIHWPICLVSCISPSIHFNLKSLRKGEEEKGET